jgi:hypothetical protein
MRTHAVCLLAVFAIAVGCRTAAPPSVLRFAPPGTDLARLRSEFAITNAERLALTPENLKTLSQDQVDQIYLRLTAGPHPDGPYRGDLFFPRDRDHNARIADVARPGPAFPSHLGALKVESLGRMLWKGKVFFWSQGILRNRIEQLTVLKPFIDNPETIPKLTFDGQTTWLLFPAKLSCGESRFDKTRPSAIVDYAKGSEVEGYREIPDKLAGPEALNIRDEVRFIRKGFYLGRAYFGDRFGLNFTLVDPATTAGWPEVGTIQEDCPGGS